MKSFESAGVWFLPDKPENQIPGTLEFSEKEGLTLRLPGGSFQRHWNIEDAQYPVICGAISDGPYGNYITLFDCFATNLQFGMPRVTAEEIHSNHGFAGGDYVESNDDPFDRTAFFLSPLGGWLNYSGLKTNYAGEEWSCTWTRPEMIEWLVDGAIISTSFEFSMKGGPLGGIVSLEEKPALRVQDFGEATAEEIHSRFLGPLSDLMTFVSDGRSNIDRHTLYKDSESFTRLFLPVLKADPPESRLRAIDLLFSLDDIGDLRETFMQNWFDFIKSHPNFCKVFFSSGYKKRGFVETRFLFQMQAACCFAIEDEPTDSTIIASFQTMREGFVKDETIGKYPEVLHAFPSAAQLATPAVIAACVDRHWPLIKEIVGTTKENFVEALFDTLEYVNYQGQRPKSVVGGLDLFRLIDRLTAVIKVWVLKSIGFSDEKIGEITTRNAVIRYQKTEKAPWG